MSGPLHFGDVTNWDVWDPHKGGIEGWSKPGWANPSDPKRYISEDDPYWNQVLEQARKVYGDSKIHYSPGGPAEGRHLVFDDGTKLPEDRTIVYHDAADPDSKNDWAQNDDGTVSLVGPDGRLGPPVAPAGYRKIGDHYAPVNDRGQQIAPQLGGVPSSDNGFKADPKTGILTPKNRNGDYYLLGPDGKKSFFDRNNAPISEEQFNNASKPRDPAQPPTDAGLPTDEQQSGKAADAVKKLQQELKNRYSKISDAEEKLSEVLLTVHATTAAGQQKLNAIQQKIVDAVNNPTMAMDTPAGERSFLTFLRNQVSEINNLLDSGGLTAEDQAKIARAQAALYAVDSGAGSNSDPPGQAPGAPQPPATPAPNPAPSPDPGISGLGPATQMPDPGLSDMLGGAPMGMPMGADPLSSLASMVPGALGGLGSGGGGSSPLEGLGGLAGAASPLAGLASQLGDHGSHERPSDTADKADDSPERTKGGKDAKTDPAKADTTPQAGGQQPAGQQGQNATTPGGEPPAAVAPPVAPSATVKLPDGSTASARNPQAAQAIRDYLAGDTVDASYRKNGIQLPPPGTPITHPVDPSRLTCGDLAMFKDHYVPVLSSVKAYLNGQVVPLGSVTSSPDFLGWIDSTAAVTGAAPPAAASPAPAAVAPAPAPAPAPVPVG